MRLIGLPLFVLVVALFTSACGSTQETEAATAPASPPSIEPGKTSTSEVEIDGVTIGYAISVPEGFTVGDEAPLLLAFPPGAQSRDDARSLVANTYAPEGSRLGWVVVSPAAPEGELFFQGSEVLIPGFLDWVETWMTPEGGAPHVVGVSNGGISTFRYASQNPTRVLSMSTLPGFPRSDEDKASLAQLTEVPIRMYVGGIDADWISPAEDTATAFSELGGDIELTIFDGEGHFVRSLADGVLLFEELESFR